MIILYAERCANIVSTDLCHSMTSNDKPCANLLSAQHRLADLYAQ